MDLDIITITEETTTTMLTIELDIQDKEVVQHLILLMSIDMDLDQLLIMEISLRGNYSSGTWVEGYERENRRLRGPGPREYYGPAYHSANSNLEYFDDDRTSGHRWGSEPLYGSGNRWGSEPLYGGSNMRDIRDTKTPLLPDNPWTHNELGREWRDAYRNGTWNPVNARRFTTVDETVTTNVNVSKSIPTPPPQPPVYIPETIAVTQPILQETVVPLETVVVKEVPAIAVVTEVIPTTTTVAEVVPTSSLGNESLTSGFGSTTGVNQDKIAPMSWYTGREGVQQPTAL